MSEELTRSFRDYHESIVAALASDEFFRYLMNAVGAGNKELSFLLKRLNKEIDMRWVETLEECILPLDTIVRNPRRFIVQEDEVVPIHLSKKVTPESVRHLAQHTHMIERIDGEEILPNKILNVSREETIDIYENRFIYTLLMKLHTFMEKRYNVLFQSMDDEAMAHIVLKGEFSPQRGEQVHYLFDMSSVSRPQMGDAQMDPRHMSALARIDRLNQYIKSFLYSPFAKEMRGCALVRPPIMRTNVIMKEQNFKKCLTLWQFIESYDEVGYSIEAVNTQQPPDEQTMTAVYSGIALQYIFLKQSEGTLPVAADTKRRARQIKPKFIKNTIEEFVDNFDVTDTEVRRIFMDKIKRSCAQQTKEQQRVIEAIDRALREDKEERRRVLEEQRKEQERQRELERRRIEREKARIEKQKALEKAKKEREREKARAAKEKAAALAKEKAQKEREREKARAAKEKAAALAKEKAQQEREREKARAAKEKAAALAKEKAQQEREREKARAAKEKAAALAKEKAQQEREREKARAAKEKAAALAKEKAQKEREREKARAAKEKAAALAKEKAQKEREREKARAAKEKAAALAKEKAQKERERKKARAAKEKVALKQAAKPKPVAVQADDKAPPAAPAASTPTMRRAPANRAQDAWRRGRRR